jgi:hypothetical protein
MLSFYVLSFKGIYIVKVCCSNYENTMCIRLCFALTYFFVMGNTLSLLITITVICQWGQMTFHWKGKLSH